MQEAGAAALSLPASYYRELAERYRTRRDHLIPALEKAGFRCYPPRGAYYVMTDISAFGFANDVQFAAHLVKEIGIACVPGSSFYKHPKDGSQQVRFAFCKKPETLDEAARRLEKLRSTSVETLSRLRQRRRASPFYRIARVAAKVPKIHSQLRYTSAQR